ncbi:hypothetical protein [Sphingomonas sp.]|jgi:hypothetical protein|uniref:hypothetical protein n=1 Tax=Sphingomonas sp. TaxID=28214 RepID=UPI002D7E857B|nr:hypothetical protein [Sphingomonas sp.]HEU0045728.1 hypothetical protein [Sphingomonas sp.]
MTKSRGPLPHDIQPPDVFLTGVALRRSYLTGPGGTPEEAELARLIATVEQPEKTRLHFGPLPPLQRD